TLNPQPSTLNPQPSTLNPQPSTLNPQPSTLNAQPEPQMYQVVVPLCGGNIDITMLGRVIERGAFTYIYPRLHTYTHVYIHVNSFIYI
ncbi:hypothetical protein T484DRAFT_1621440, partial [Baffinella frigidus]